MLWWCRCCWDTAAAAACTGHSDAEHCVHNTNTRPLGTSLFAVSSSLSHLLRDSTSLVNNTTSANAYISHNDSILNKYFIVLFAQFQDIIVTSKTRLIWNEMLFSPQICRKCVNPSSDWFSNEPGDIQDTIYFCRYKIYIWVRISILNIQYSLDTR